MTRLARKKGILIATVVCMGMVALAGAAYADPISALPVGVPLQFKYNNYEGLITEGGQTLSGIFNVSTIQADPGPAPTYWAGNGISDGTQLVGVFTALISGTPEAVEGGFNIKFTGGELAMFVVPNGSFDSTGGPGTLGSIMTQACGGACPDPWLTAKFDPGILVGDASTTLFSTVSNLTGPATGTGSGYLSVADTINFGTGVHNGVFDNNGQHDGNGGVHDFFLTSNLVICPGPGCSGNWPVASNDPLHTSIIPEPTSVLLLGAGLAGIGVWRRMKKS
jgi:hypothetical protein